MIRISLTFLTLCLMTSTQAQPDADKTEFNQAIKKARFAYFFQNAENYRQANSLAKEAQDIFSELGIGDGVMSSHNLIISNYLRLLEIDSAEVHVHQSKQDRSRYELNHFSLVGHYFSLGQYYLTVAQIDSSLYYFQRLPPLLEELSVDQLNVDLGPEDLQLEVEVYLKFQIASLRSQIDLIWGHSYNGLGLAYFANLEYGLAASAFRNALAFYEKQGTRQDQANALINLGQVELMHRAESDSAHSSAIEHYRRAEKLLEETPQKDNAFLSLVNRFLGATSLVAGDSIGALDKYQKGKVLLEGADSSQLAKTAWISKELFHHVYTLEWLQLSIALSPADSYVVLLDQVERAVEALPAESNEISMEFRIAAYGDLGQIHAQLNNWDRAFYWFDRALKVYWPETNPFAADGYDLDQISYLVNTHGLKLLIRIADAYRKKAALGKERMDNVMARRFYRAAGDVLEAKRFGFTAQSGNTYLKEEALFNAEYLARLVYQGAIAATLQADMPVKRRDQLILEYIQRCKAFVLDQAIRDLKAFKEIPPDKILEEKVLKSQLNEWKVKYRIAQRLKRHEEAAAIGRKIIITGDELEIFYQQLAETYPQYFQSKDKDRFLSAGEIQADLVRDSQSALVEYLIVPAGRIYIVCVTIDTVFVRDMPLPVHLTKLIGGVNTFTTEPKNYRVADPAIIYADYANKLYELLIGPIEEILQPIDHLIIAPDQQLHRLNFDCLLTGPVSLQKHISNGKFTSLPEYGRFPYLLTEFSTQYVESPLILQEQNRMEPAPAGANVWDYGGVEPRYEMRTSADVDSVLDRSAYLALKNGIPFPNLPMVETVAPLFGEKSKVWTGEEAGEEKLSSELENNAFRILHFSAHGLLNDFSPLASKLLLTHINSTDQWDDALEVRELYRMRLQAQLGIISSCDSGNSYFTPTGEGLISIGRGFFYAGCPSLLISKWPLLLKSTEKIVYGTCLNLKQGKATAKALQLAKLTYLQENTNQADNAPFFWAGLNLWGKNGVLFQK